MDGKTYKKGTVSTDKRSSTARVIRGIVSGAVFFALCILIIPLILSKTANPEDFITVSAVITVSVTAFAAAFSANRAGGNGFLLTGITVALAIILILVLSSVMFGKSGEDRNYLFSGILYCAVFVFSLLGAKLSGNKKSKKKNRRKR